MNFRTFALNMLAFLVIVPHGIILPMENNLSPEEQAAQQEIDTMQHTINNAIAKASEIDTQKILDGIDLDVYENQPQNSINTFIPGLEHFMPNIDKKTKAFAKEQERAKYQNTILLGHPKSPVALYRRDLMELPFFAADIAIAYLFFENIKKKRVEYLYNLLTEDTTASIELFTQIKELQKSGEKPDANKEEIIQKLVELWKQVLEKHSYIGNNPFRLEVVIPFLSALAGHKLNRYAQEKHIIKRSFAPESQYAYTQDEQGNYHQFEMEGFFATPTLDDWKNKANINSGMDFFKLECGVLHSLHCPGNAPMSATTATKAFYMPNPNADPFLDQMPEFEGFIPEGLFAKAMYQLVGLPGWFYDVKNSRPARFALEIPILASITTHIDAVYNATWIVHIEKNIDKLIRLLHAHEAVKQLPKEHIEKQAVRKELLEFIQTGNTCASWQDACQKFFFYKSMGRMGVAERIMAWTVTSVAASLLWKSRSLVKFALMAGKNNLLPAEAWLAGGVVTSYLALLFAPVTIVSTAQVYLDICWIKDKVKDTIKSFFSKENNNQKQDNNELNTPKEAIA
jgi:hypothetical protein